MKRFITLSTLFLICMAINAQVQLTIETTAGGLKDAMTEEQRQTVTNLTLTGSMNDADFYMIRDEMPKLKYLDMKQVEVDTIPQRAFYDNFIIYEIILPLNIKYIDDEAFCESSAKFYVTGNFPKLGNKVFYGGFGRMPSISEDNVSCISVSNSIYSSDGKILYYYFGLNNNTEDFDYIPEGTEVIAERAFDCSFLQKSIIFPSTLKRVDNYAFKNTVILVPAGYDHVEPDCFSFKSEQPPVLAENAFVGEIFQKSPLFYVIVPKGAKGVYKNSDPQWGAFDYILEEGEAKPESITSNAVHSLSVVKNDSYWILKGESMIKSIEVFTPSGRLLHSILCNNIEVCLPTSHFRGVQIVKICYADEGIEIIKLTN